MIGHQYFYRHHDSALIETISQNDIYQILLNLEEVFLEIFLIVSCCLMLQLIAFYYVYVTYHHVQHRSTPISPPSYEASRENSNVKQKPEFSA
uniref:Uncharacterized protein n=1 Tax=Panagrolaimus sp. PS1159 TaxID=55785 RepID=A0AC35G3T9_9BILA